MTIIEAAEKWEVKEKTIFDYILKGYIYGLSIENNEIIVPDIPKPYIKKKPKTVKEKDRYILAAMNKECYVNAKIMGIEQDSFEERLKVLIASNEILPKEKEKINYLSNLDFILSPQKRTKFEVEFSPSITVTPSFEIKAADQIGLSNIKVGV